MSYSYTNYGGVPIDTSSCWPNLEPGSRALAQEINSIIDKYPDHTKDLSNRFQSVMTEARNAGLCPFIPGFGPTMEKSHKLLEEARRLPSKMELILQREKMEAEFKAKQEAAAAAAAEQEVEEAGPRKPYVDQEAQEMRERLKQLKEAKKMREDLKKKHLKAVSDKHKKQAAYGRDTVQKKGKSESYATEAEKLIGGRSGYYSLNDTDKPTNTLQYLIALGFGMFAGYYLCRQGMK